MKNLVFLFVFIPFILAAQHDIKGTFSPAEEFTYALLYKATPTGANYVSQGKVEENGSFTIHLDASVASGLYKIVYATPPEENNFNFFYNSKEDVVLNFSLDTGLSFISSNDNLLWETYLDSISNINSEISEFYLSESTNKKIINAIFKRLKETQDSYEKTAEGTLSFPFIKSNRTYIPESFEDVSTYSNNLKETYFNYIDFSDELLQSSDFLIERVIAYVFAMSPESAAYNKAVDEVVVATGENEIAQITILENLWQQMAETENIDVANYISDTYLFDLATKNNNTLLIETLLEYKNTALGNKALNFDFSYVNQDLETINTNLYSLNKASRYVLLFWSSTCSHCLSEIPILQSLMTDYPEIKVIAFSLENEAENWQNTIKNYPEFIHIIGLEKWDNPVVKKYAVNSTPTYFVLDKDKVIVAKPESVDDLKKYLEN